MTFKPMKPATIVRRASNRAAEQLRRHRDAVERLRPLAERDPEMWAELYTDALARLVLTEAIFAAPAPETHVTVGDHPPERRVEHSSFGPSDAARWGYCPGSVTRNGNPT